MLIRSQPLALRTLLSKVDGKKQRKQLLLDVLSAPSARALDFCPSVGA